MVEYDFFVVIYYVFNVINVIMVYYIGYFQGMMIVNVQFSVDKDLVFKIKLFIFMVLIVKVMYVRGFFGFINLYVIQKVGFYYIMK